MGLRQIHRIDSSRGVQQLLSIAPYVMAPIRRLFTAAFRHRVLAAAGVVVSVAVISCGSSGGERTPLIFAAASLSEALSEIGERYAADTGGDVDFSFGGSLMLANQIASLGAPADGLGP